MNLQSFRALLPALFLVALTLLLTACDVVPRDAEGRLTEGYELAFGSVRVGDCFDDPDPSEVRTGGEGAASVFSLRGVPCAEPHDNEVYALLEYGDAADAPYPGEQVTLDRALEGCFGVFEAYVGASYSFSRFEFDAYYPTRDSWEQAGDREYICYLYDLDFAKLEGTARDSGE